MPITPTYPGIYIEELSSSTHTIMAAPTSKTVFVGYTHPFLTKIFNKPIELFSFTDYETNFGGFFKSDFFDAEAALFGDIAQSVNQFFLNGGADAYVVGLLPSKIISSNGAGGFTQANQDFLAFQTAAAAYQAAVAQNQQGQLVDPNAYPEALSANVGPLIFFPIQFTDPPVVSPPTPSRPYAGHVLQITISNVRATYPSSAFSSPPPSLTFDYSYSLPYSSPSDDLADITITYGPPAGSPLAGYGTQAETYRQVSLNPLGSNGKPNPNFVMIRINGVSKLAMVGITSLVLPLQVSGGPQPFPPTVAGTPWVGFSSTTAPPIFQASDFINVFNADTPLDKLSIFNLLVIPGVTDNVQGAVLSYASAFCERKRALLIMDPPADASADGTLTAYPILIEDIFDNVPNPLQDVIPQSTNSALYFPYLTTNDPVTGLSINPVTSLPYEIPPSGTVAGIFANTDSTLGVWVAAAGLSTTLTNVNDVVERGQMTDQRQGTLNPLGVNCIRTFPATPPVIWGNRTSISANTAFQQWRYVCVRRTALFLEQSLYFSLGWVVFQPNAQPLWTAIVQSINSFMLSLFNQGAFQGTTPSQAFQVKCDSSTTTQTDIDSGVVNILVAFAPLKPAEFVVIQIAQLAGQSSS